MSRTLFNKAYSAYDVLCIHADMAWSTLRAGLSCRLQGCRLGSGFRTTSNIRIKARAAGSIFIDLLATIDYQTTLKT